MFIVKQDDLFPPVDATVTDADGTVVDVTGATIKFSMRNSRSPSTVKVNGATGSIVDAAAGKIRYTMVGTDTDTPGTYEGEFQVIPSQGDSMRVPTEGYITVVVEEKVA